MMLDFIKLGVSSFIPYLVAISFGCVLLCAQGEIFIHLFVLGVLSLNHILMQLLPSLDQLSIVIVLLFLIVYVIFIIIT
jgi:hypothetical protein